MRDWNNRIRQRINEIRLGNWGTLKAKRIAEKLVGAPMTTRRINYPLQLFLPTSQLYTVPGLSEESQRAAQFYDSPKAALHLWPRSLETITDPV